MTRGVLIIDKPTGITSHDVVDRVRSIVGTRKVGHLGTLDPLATGVLPVAVGKATRLARYFPTSPKEYIGTIRLGWETTTGDADGSVLEERPVSVSGDTVGEAMKALTGRITQVPPAYSAKKVGGVPAYELAREGRAVALRPVTVDVEAFDLVDFSSPTVTFHIVCSAGTYVRSLARDLGRGLGTGAHLASLRRTRAGIFGLEDARTLDRVTPEDVIPPETLLAGTVSLVVDDTGADRVRHGSPIPCPSDAPVLCIFNKNGELIAIGVAEKGWVHPKVVLI